MSIEPVNPTMTRDELVAAAESIGMRFPAPVAQGEPVALLWRVRRALALAMRICDRVPNRWHYTHEIGSAEADIGDMVNAHPDGTHGYREIQEAESALTAYLTTPEAAPAPVLTPAQKHADELVEALSDIAHGLEHARIWGGMKWEYNPLHPIHYVPLRDKARAVLAKIEATGQEGGAA